MIDPFYKSCKNCHPQTFIVECKYKIIEKKTKTFIVDEVEISVADDCNEKDFEENTE